MREKVKLSLMDGSSELLTCEPVLVLVLEQFLRNFYNLATPYNMSSKFSYL